MHQTLWCLTFSCDYSRACKQSWKPLEFCQRHVFLPSVTQLSEPQTWILPIIKDLIMPIIWLHPINQFFWPLMEAQSWATTTRGKPRSSRTRYTGAKTWTLEDQTWFSAGLHFSRRTNLQQSDSREHSSAQQTQAAGTYVISGAVGGRFNLNHHVQSKSEQKTHF